MSTPAGSGMCRDPEQFIEHVRNRLWRRETPPSPGVPSGRPAKRDSVVLLPVTDTADAAAGFAPSLILNKRSERVRQAGDLCYPGGSVAPLDSALSLLLRFLPVSRWSHANGRAAPGKTQAATAVRLATGLREAWEEMRMNPLRLALLGILPVERLVLFDRRIHPIVVWASPRQHYSTNWEVARIVHIPIAELLQPGNYARYRPVISGMPVDRREVFPCFIHHGRQGREILWGVSYRITMNFISRVFDFEPPESGGLPLIEGSLSATYMG